MSLLHKKIAMGHALLGEGRSDLTALIAAHLTGLFLEQPDPLTLTEIADKLGLQDKYSRTQLSRVLGLMHKKGMVTVDWPSRRWSSNIIYEDEAIYKTSVRNGELNAHIFNNLFPDLVKHLEQHEVTQ